MKVRIGLYPLPRSIEQKGYLRGVCQSAPCMILSLLTAGCCICSCRFPVIWWWVVRTAPSLLKVLLSIYTTLPRRPQGPAQGPPPPFNVHIKKRKEKREKKKKQCSASTLLWISRTTSKRHPTTVSLVLFHVEAAQQATMYDHIYLILTCI